MKTHYIVRIYILTDRLGEWWETLKTDGSLDRFQPGTANWKKDKEFGSVEKAKRAGETKKVGRFKVVKLEPPVKPSIEWIETVVYQHGT